MRFERRRVTKETEYTDAADLSAVLAQATTIVTDGALLFIDGQKAAVVADEETANCLLRRAIERGTAAIEGTDVIEQGFTKEVEIVTQTVDADDILSEDDAFVLLCETDEPSLCWRVVYTYRQRVPIEPETTVVSTDLLPLGSTEVVAEGSAGEQENLIRAEAQNGIVVTSEIMTATVLQEATNAIVYEGAREPSTSTISRGGEEIAIPVEGIVTAVFDAEGSHWQHRHTGLDLACPEGTEIRSYGAGVVTVSDWGGAYGNMITIDHGDGLVTRYCHLSGFNVTAGDTVSRGDVIGYCGATGNATGPHLHFEVLIDGEFQDPVAYL